MKVRELMKREVRSCLVDDNLDWAAHLMWDGDCGALPVVGKEENVVGIITDRDICMAAYTKGLPLSTIKVEEAMARQVTFCSPESTLETAMALMKEARVRRLPVVDGAGKLVGILSLNDLACEAREATKHGGGNLRSIDVADTLGVICGHRLPPARSEKARNGRKAELVESGA